MSEFVKEHYGTKLEKKDLSVKGWNWGIAKFVGTLSPKASIRKTVPKILFLGTV